MILRHITALQEGAHWNPHTAIITSHRPARQRNWDRLLNTTTAHRTEPQALTETCSYLKQIDIRGQRLSNYAGASTLFVSVSSTKGRRNAERSGADRRADHPLIYVLEKRDVMDYRLAASRCCDSRNISNDTSCPEFHDDASSCLVMIRLFSR